jgi:hypothetical protein
MKYLKSYAIFELGETQASFPYSGPEERYTINQGLEYRYYFQVKNWDYVVIISEVNIPGEYHVAFKAKLEEENDLQYRVDVETNTGQWPKIMATIMDILEDNYEMLKKNTNKTINNMKKLGYSIENLAPPIVYLFKGQRKKGQRKKGQIGIPTRTKLYYKYLQKKFPTWKIEPTENDAVIIHT